MSGGPHLPDLAPDCSRCFGLCCVALPLTRSADFPVDKPAGEPCRNLLADDRCRIHDRLRETGWKGCTVFDCFGAGQQVSQVTFGGVSWRQEPGTAASMFAVLPVLRQVHEVLALLSEAADLVSPERDPEAAAPRAEVDALLAEAAAITEADASTLLAIDLDALRRRVGPVLGRVSAHVRASAPGGRGSRDRRARPGADLVGADLRGADLRGCDLRGALLIAADLREADLRRADLLGADLRDADLRGADLDGVLYLTRPQRAAART